MGGGMTYTWKILDVFADSENKIAEIRYHLTLTNGDDKVETEGYYRFNSPQQIFPELTENQVIFALENDGSQDFIAAIKSCLEGQMAAIQGISGPIRAPWLGAETFTVSL